MAGHPLLVTELGLTYSGDARLSRQIGFAYWDARDSAIWVSYTDEGVVRVVDRDTRRVLRTIPQRADWIGASPAGNMLVADRFGGRIVELDRAGRELRATPARHPTCVQTTDVAGSFVVAESRPVRLSVTDLDGLSRWSFSPQPPQLRRCGSVAPWRDGLLLADPLRHVLSHVGFDGTTTIVYGSPELAGSAAGYLCLPQSAIPLDQDRVLVCDSQNGRVLEVSLTDGVQWQFGDADHYGSGPGHLWSPRVAQEIDAEHVLICDAKNGRVLIARKSGGVEWEWGEPLVRRFQLKMPRSVQRVGDTVVVADTYHHRVVALSGRGEVRWEYGQGTAGSEAGYLNHPRCARMLGDRLFIADSRNQRVLVLDRRLRAMREYARLTYRRSEIPLRDPHDLLLLPSGAYVLVDAVHNAVMAFREEGDVLWVYDQLQDPHQVALTPDRTLLIADTGNHRIVELDMKGDLLRTHEGWGAQHLSGPRACVRGSDFEAVLDTQTHRVLLSALSSSRVSALGIAESPLASFDNPRWLALETRTLLVADTGNSRVLIYALMTGGPPSHPRPDATVSPGHAA